MEDTWVVITFGCGCVLRLCNKEAKKKAGEYRKCSLHGADKVSEEVIQAPEEAMVS